MLLTCLPLVILVSILAPAQAERDLARTPVTWETLEARMESEAKAGFSGAVLVVRAGEVVLDAAHGLANREKAIANRPDTVFAVGSTPTCGAGTRPSTRGRSSARSCCRATSIPRARC